ncbi:MAG: autotransporter-associated beta strand repeat-containing protein [Candidatus Didemnitutus sp.]|nr:autotransporter-associated beta strand repeat-containing protein [Candidatus Didemnitutus sp.]
MNRTRAIVRGVALLAVAAFVPSLFAQQLTWTGGNDGKGNILSTGSNWQEGTAPTATADLYIASTVNTSIPTLLVGANYSVRSFIFNNATAQYSATNGLRIVSTTSASSSTARILSFDTAGTLITATNNANASFRSGSISGSSTADPLPSLTLFLNYSGMGVIDVRDTSIVLIADGSNNVPGAVITGTGGLQKIGPGTLRLNGNHTYSGGFILDEGTVIITTNGTNTTTDLTSSAFGLGTLRLNNGTVTSNSTASRQILSSTVFGGGTITFGASATSGNINFPNSIPTSSITVLANTTINVAGASFWNQTIISDAVITKTGTGNLGFGIVAAASTYAGGFELKEGNVVLNSSGSNGTVDPKSSGFGTGTLTLSGGAIMSSNTTAGGGNRTLYNPIALNGTIALSEAAAESGIFVSALWGSATTLIAPSTINTPGANITWSQNISGNFGLTKTGPAMLTLSGINTYTGDTTVSEGILRGDAESITGDVVNHAALIFNEDTGGTYAGVISGNGTVTKQGTAALTLSGTHTYTGLTSLTEGTLVIDGSIPGALDTAATTTLAGSGTIGGHATVAGTHTPGNSAGTQTFGANLTYAAGSTIGWDLAAHSTAGADSDHVIVAGTLDFAGPVTLTPAFAGTGSTVDWKNAFWLEEHTWVVFDAATVSNFQNLQLSPATWPDSTGASFDSALAGASFSLSQSGGDVLLHFTPAPVIADPYTTWLAEYFTTEELNLPTVSGALADPDRDGLANLLEYALGLDPRAASPTAVPATSTENGFWVFLYTRPANRSDVSYVVEVSTNLQQWTTIAANDHEPVATVGETATWRARYSQTGAPNAFFRLRVEPVAVQ